MVHDALVDMEGPVQIIFHEQIRFDGLEVTVDRVLSASSAADCGGAHPLEGFGAPNGDC